MSAFLPPTFISDADFEQVRSIVYKKIGLSLSDSKKALVISRLGKHLKNLHISSFNEYLEYLDSTPRAYEEMISRITTHFTGFFREAIQFEILHKEILPQLQKVRAKEKRLRIWSAACSSGEELYSILMEVNDYFGGEIPDEWDIKILGTDIDQQSLAIAKKGIYPAAAVLSLSERRVIRFFLEEKEGSFRFNPRYTSNLRFAQLNLMSKRYPFKNKMDIIFCRNVAIYFDSKGKTHLYHTLHQHLAGDGYLFSGHSESLLRYPELFKPLKRSIYVKRND